MINHSPSKENDIDPFLESGHQPALLSPPLPPPPPPSDLSSPLLDAPSSTLPPSLDPHLSTVRLFWYLFWLCLAEVIYISGLVVNYTIVTSEVVKHQEDAHDSSEEQDSPKLSPFFLILYFVPSSLVLLGAAITFVSKRYNYLLRKVLLGVVCLALIGGIAGK